jgi:phosphate transport system substrate-binding protein
MNDDFLHRIRTDPPPRFIASLKARLDQLGTESTTRPSIRSRNMIIGGMIAGAALATGLFVARAMYSLPSPNAPPSRATNTSPEDRRQPYSRPQPVGSTAANVAEAATGKIPGADKTPGRLSVGTSIAISPHIQEATQFINMNMNVYPPFIEPTVSMMSSNAAIASLCASGDSIDAAIVDRRILPEELDACHRQKKPIAEIKLGYEAIALVRSNLYDAPRLSTRTLFLALAREIPDPSNPGNLVVNPNVTWDQIDSSLPNERIDVSGPPLSTAIGMAFRELILKAGCAMFPTIESLKEKNPLRFEEVCSALRTDGAYQVREASGGTERNAFDFTDYLNANPQAIAVLGYHEETLRAWNLSAGSIDGVTPSPSMIHAGSYPGARVIYLYVNSGVPRMRNFVLAMWSSVGKVAFAAPGDEALMPAESTERRNITTTVLALPDL